MLPIYTHGTHRLSALQAEFVVGRFHYLPRVEFQTSRKDQVTILIRLACVDGVPAVWIYSHKTLMVPFNPGRMKMKDSNRAGSDELPTLFEY